MILAVVWQKKDRKSLKEGGIQIMEKDKIPVANLRKYVAQKHIHIHKKHRF